MKPAKTRQNTLERLQNENFDLLIIGGGINGAAIARDAALRGLKTALIEKRGFASGTSSRSSKLIHGGLRYLEHFNFSLVKESCRERNLLVKHCPGLVKPLPFFFPVFKDDRLPLWMVSLGLKIYDWMDRTSNFKPHQKISADSIKEIEPGIKSDSFKGGAIYFDAQTDDARLVLENINDARKHGALAGNWIEARHIQKEGKVFTVQARDFFTGSDFKINALSVINAGGPWVDLVLGLNGTFPKPMLQFSKGVHLFLKPGKISIQQAVTIQSSKDDRILFIIPVTPHERAETFILIGTTDTHYQDSLDQVSATTEEIHYLLEELKRYFPAVKISQEDILSTFSGIRPLIAQGKKDSQKVSRGDKIVESASGLITVAGGKLTTFRNMAYRAVKRAVKNLAAAGKKDFDLSDITQANMISIKTGSFKKFQEILGPETEDISAYFAARYGGREAAVQEILKEHPELKKRISSTLPFTLAETLLTIREEQCLSLIDFYRLHTQIFLLDQKHGMDTFYEVALLFREELEWEDPEYERQKKMYRDFIHENERWRENFSEQSPAPV